MDNFTGYANIMFRDMRRMNNLTFELSFDSKGHFGGLRSNGSFYGTVSAVANKLVDISITAYTFLPSRFQVDVNQVDKKLRCSFYRALIMVLSWILRAWS